jgi:hypothetical protein
LTIIENENLGWDGYSVQSEEKKESAEKEDLRVPCNKTKLMQPCSFIKASYIDNLILQLAVL